MKDNAPTVNVLVLSEVMWQGDQIQHDEDGCAMNITFFWNVTIL
jgi:hypothetical protein